MIRGRIHMKPKAVTLLSGGIDSATTLALAKAEGYDCFALTLDYGQRHKREIESAKKVAKALDAAEHKVLSLDLRQFGGSALTGDLDVPKGRDNAKIASGIPVTYVPARNLVFLSLALGWAEVLCSRDLFIGVNAIDYSGYPDCRPKFIESFQKTANLATKAGVEGERFRIHTPLIHMTKSEIILQGDELGLDFSLTHSCYDPLPDGAPCGRCDSCLLRAKGFSEAGIRDPLVQPDP